MPVNLNQPLAWKSADADGRALLHDLQANILKGHGRKHTSNLFLRFDDADAGRAFVRAMAPHVTRAQQQLDDNERFRHTGQPAGLVTLLMLSHDGYRALRVAAGKVPRDAAFRAGMAARGTLLADPPTSRWDRALRGELHALVLLADRSATLVRQARKALLARLPPQVVLVAEETGLGRQSRFSPEQGVEHFGYVDGRSQPLMLQEDIAKERDERDGISVWNPAVGLKTALVRDPAGAGPNSCGSYLVFRKLEQNVCGFHQASTRLAKALKLQGDEAERAGALIVGRFRDGTPVVQYKAAGANHPVPNNFDFRDDLFGAKCPLHSHIRKANPRGETTLLGATLAQERSHLMPRRGITYGHRSKAPDSPALRPDELPTKNVGLLFMAYQNDIAQQFEFVQAQWANSHDFSRVGTGIDPVIGQGSAGGQACGQFWGGGQDHPSRRFDFRGFVTMKGGGYFFAPSISGLMAL